MRERLNQIECAIADACARSRRARDETRLVAVSKGHSIHAIEEAYELGLRDFGESYAQELVYKANALHQLIGLRWHFVGPLQRNKTNLVGPCVALLHSLDRLSLAERLNGLASPTCPLRVLVQLNLSGESTKAGLAEEALGPFLDRLRLLPALRCVGLMTLPPPSAKPESNRPYFSRLRSLLQEYRQVHPELVELSMGMSDDFVSAIEEGSTLLRLGTALFGPRV
jgi:pyridoxal phosphate enzyme (YggS family)